VISPARRRWLLAVVALLALIAVLVAWRPRGDDETAPVVASAPPNPALARFPKLAALVARAPAGERAGLHMLEDPALPLPVADYLIASRFPPHSRPLEAGMLDLIEPNRREDSPDAVKHADRSIGDPDLEVLWSGDRFRLVGDVAMDVWLEVTRAGARVPVRVVRARAYAVAPADRRPLGLEVALPLREDASHLWTGSFAVRGTPLARHVGEVVLEVVYDYGGVEPGVATLQTYVQPDDDPPARFTAHRREELVAGSIFVHVGIDVIRAGDYVFDANVYDAAGRPTAYLRWKGALPAGAGEIPLEIYGRIAHELDAQAPFAITDLRGYRFLLGQAPDRELMADAAGAYTTRGYRRDELTRDEFWDPAKQAQVERLLAAARRGTKTILRTTLGEAIESGWEPAL
jgi:hypothetical protein